MKFKWWFKNSYGESKLFSIAYKKVMDIIMASILTLS